MKTFWANPLEAFAMSCRSQTWGKGWRQLLGFDRITRPCGGELSLTAEPCRRDPSDRVTDRFLAEHAWRVIAAEDLAVLPMNQELLPIPVGELSPGVDRLPLRLEDGGHAPAALALDCPFVAVG